MFFSCMSSLIVDKGQKNLNIFQVLPDPTMCYNIPGTLNYSNSFENQNIKKNH